jgi:hypothetical protein
MDSKESQTGNKMWNKSQEYKTKTSTICTATVILHKINIALES